LIDVKEQKKLWDKVATKTGVPYSSSGLTLYFYFSQVAKTSASYVKVCFSKDRSKLPTNSTEVKVSTQEDPNCGIQTIKMTETEPYKFSPEQTVWNEDKIYVAVYLDCYLNERLEKICENLNTEIEMVYKNVGDYSSVLSAPVLPTLDFRYSTDISMDATTDFSTDRKYAYYIPAEGQTEAYFSIQHPKGQDKDVVPTLEWTYDLKKNCSYNDNDECKHTDQATTGYLKGTTIKAEPIKIALTSGSKIKIRLKMSDGSDAASSLLVAFLAALFFFIF